MAGSLVAVARAEPAPAAPVPDGGRIAAGGTLRVHVPEAVGGKTVIGQLTVDNVLGAGFVTAYACNDGLPTDAGGTVARSDLNYDGRRSSVASNRLIVQADANGDVCLYVHSPAAIVVDVNAVSFDTGVNSFPNRRTDTRDQPPLPAGGEVRVHVPEAVGGRTVVGQLTVDEATRPGFVTAYGCAAGLPVDGAGRATRSDLNYAGGAAPVAANRLLVQADAAGDVCFFTSRPVAMVVDVNGVGDVGITPFPNRRTDTRASATPLVTAGGTLRINVPEATGGGTVLAGLTVDRVTASGYVTAYGCADGVPSAADGAVARSDLNFDGSVSPVTSNRLVVRADEVGDVCFLVSQDAALIVDVNGVAAAGISSFPNRRIDTRTGEVIDTGAPNVAGARTWPLYLPAPALDGVAALTGRPADASVTGLPILAAKIDNYATARPPWGLEAADAVIEVNVEGVSRFIALFQSNLPAAIGPVRSARTGDFDLLSAMNRPVFAYSGANDGVLQWAGAADGAGVIFDFGAQHAPCYFRSPDKPGPHNLVLDTSCAYHAAATAGPARPLWTVDAGRSPTVDGAGAPDTTFDVAMDGVVVQWQWDAATGRYRRYQDGEAHTTVSGEQLLASTVAVLGVTYTESVADARSPNAVTVGTGAAVLHRNGRAVEAVWSRSSEYEPFRFFDAATGAELAADEGVTWLELSRA